MKLHRYVLIALALLICAGFASANPVDDPSVIINRTTSDATPFTGLFDITLSGGNANVLFENALSVDITKVIVQFEVPLPTGVNTCSSDIFSSCGIQSISFNSKTDLLTEDFVFAGGVITPDELFSFSAGGFTGANPIATVSTTPEPGTVVLLLTGALPLLGFARKCFRANPTA
jgi:hypothetical protein